jgi:uncharacterized metal-binding protein
MTQSTVPGSAKHELTLIIVCSQAASVAQNACVAAELNRLKLGALIARRGSSA